MLYLLTYGSFSIAFPDIVFQESRTYYIGVIYVFLVCITDESDWDSDSQSSSPGQRMTSPGLEDRSCSNLSVKKDEDDFSDAPVLPQSIIENKTCKSSSPVPCPQPSPRKMGLQKKENIDSRFLFACFKKGAHSYAYFCNIFLCFKNALSHYHQHMVKLM